MKLVSIEQKILELSLKRHLNNYGKVYMFHCVDNQIQSHFFNLSISVDGFETFIQKLLKKGVRFGELNSLDVKKTRKDSYITFDDIFSSAYYNAIPFLRKMQIPYTVFISSSLVGKESYIGEKELFELKQDKLCTIGAHSRGHKISCNLSAEELKEEISKQDFEKYLGSGVELYAHPYGSLYACPKSVVHAVGKEGYKLGFSTINGSLVPRYIKNNPYFLPRINVNESNYQYYCG